MPLPGRLPNHKEDKVLLLPCSCGKSEVYRQYVHAKTVESKCAVSWAKFHSLWKEILPHISTMKLSQVKISPEVIAFDNLPNEYHPKGMDLTRQCYLYNEIAPFCSSPETAAISCPCPQEAVSEEPISATATKRKRTCSHCRKEGHTKTKKGKVTSPQLM